MANILLVEDHQALSDELMEFLCEQGHQPHLVTRLSDALIYLEQHSVDILILDRLLPDGDSLKQMPAVRQRHHGVILMLTALAILDDRVAGLEAGADYYLTKPLRLSELNAVIDSLLYRHQHLQNIVSQTLPQWQLNHQHMKLVLPNDAEIALTGQEFLLLAYLMRHVDETINKSVLISALQHPDKSRHVPKSVQDAHALDLYDSKRIETIIYRIRRKIEHQYHGEVPLVNVYGVGYSWRSHLTDKDHQDDCHH